MSGSAGGSGRPVELTEGASPRTAVVTAMPEEVSALLSRLEDRTEVPLTLESRGAEADAASRSGEAPIRTAEAGEEETVDLTLGFLGGEPLAVLVSGDGARRSAAGVAALLRVVPVSRLLVVGAAGGLSPDLAPADLVLAREVVGVDGRRFEASDADEPAARAVGARLGTAVTADRLVLSVDEKRRLRESTGVVGVCVVDIESAHLVAEAEEAGLPWTVIRAVSDTASEDLPDLLGTYSETDGAIRRSALLRHAALHPSVIPELIRLRNRIELCGRALAGAVERYLGLRSGASRAMAAS